MTRVNWELMSGEAVEEFVAALLLLKHPRGNIITPAQGDRGIDIRIPTEDNRFDIYQVKRYTRPLTTKQLRSVEGSWREFVDKTLPLLPVRSWNLVTPWNPTNNRLEWLKELTSGVVLDESPGWIGRTNLDVCAAHNSRLVDYYFGDGGRRTEELMAQALAGAKELPNIAGHDLLSAIAVRQEALAAALDEVDPFYRYTSEIRVGRLGPLDAPDPGFAALIGTDSDECSIVVRELGEHHLWILRIHPLSAESLRLRPLSTTITMSAEPGSPEHTALQRFVTYGVAPDIPLPARVIRIGAAAAPRADLPDLELKIEPSGRTVELVNIQRTTGLHGNGLRIAGTDRAGSIEVEFLANDADHTAELQITPHDVGGQPPRLVLPTLQAMEELFSGSATVTLAIAGGPGLIRPWEVERDEKFQRSSTTWAALAKALMELQRHTTAQLTMPHSINSGEYNQILDAAAILRGEIVEDEWDGVAMNITDPEAVTSQRSEGEFAIMVIRPLVIKYDGRAITFDDRFITHTPTARFEDPAALAEVQPGDVVRLVPGSNPLISRRLFQAQPDSEGSRTGRGPVQTQHGPSAGAQPALQLDIAINAPDHTGPDCTGATKSGRPCGIAALPGRNLCHIHAPELQCGALKSNGRRCAIATGGRGPCATHR
jgi:hypothetical protein